MREYHIVGRAFPTNPTKNPEIYKMQIFAPNSVVAKSKFLNYLTRLKKIKKRDSEIISIIQSIEKNKTVLRNYGIWLRYKDSSGPHDVYMEVRETTRPLAISRMFQLMASTYRAKYDDINIIRISELKDNEIRKPYTEQFLDKNIKFPPKHGTSKPHRPIFVPTTPSYNTLV